MMRSTARISANASPPRNATGYSGPYTLIYEDKGADEWTAVEIERDFVRSYFNGGHA